MEATAEKQEIETNKIPLRWIDSGLFGSLSEVSEGFVDERLYYRIELHEITGIWRCYPMVMRYNRAGIANTMEEAKAACENHHRTGEWN